MPERTATDRHLTLEQAPEQLRALPEPLRSKALAAANELLEKDKSIGRDEALRQAVEEAQEYRATRMPHADIDGTESSPKERR